MISSEQAGGPAVQNAAVAIRNASECDGVVAIEPCGVL